MQKTVVLHFFNSLLAAAIELGLEHSGAFHPVISRLDDPETVVLCASLVSADVVILEVSRLDATCIPTRLREIHQIRKRLPSCKIVLLCDGNACPKQAEECVQLKERAVVDDFCSSSIQFSDLFCKLQKLFL